MNTKYTPIVLFVYNRPDHTRRTVDALLKNEYATESILYVFADGAKDNASEEQIERVNEVREYIHSIQGFKNVIVEESARNKGLANSIIYGVTKVVNEYGKVIVVEDDIVTHPFFLRYMNDCLSIYEDREDVFMIGGFSVNIKFPWWYLKDIYATYRSCSWGWATWKDRWNKSNWELPDFNSFCNDSKRIELFNRGGADMFPMLQAQMEGKIDSWAIRWDYCISQYNGICVRPVKTLCICIGFDGSGFHCGQTDKILNNTMYPLNGQYKIKLKKNIRVIPSIANRFKAFYEQTPPSVPFVIRCLKKAFRLFKRIMHIQ